MVCKKCGNQMPDGMLFCDKCGSKTEYAPPKKICKNCGAEINPESGFCGNCGMPVGTAGVTDTAKSETAAVSGYDNSRKSSKRILIPIISAAAVVVVAAAAAAAGYALYSNGIDKKSSAEETLTPENTPFETVSAQPEEAVGVAETPIPTPVPTPIPTAVPNTKVIATRYVANCNEYITLRSAPSTSAKEVAKVPLGQAVGYIENAENGFSKINYDGAVGYVLSAYLSADKPREEEHSAPVFSNAKASSVRSNMTDSNGNIANYSPQNVLDGDNTTCWAMDVTTGIEPSITLSAGEKQYISGVKFSNGYFKSEAVYNANRKITRVEIIYDGGSKEYSCAANQYMILQDVKLDAPVYSTYITIKILDSAAADYSDICISTVEVY